MNVQSGQQKLIMKIGIMNRRPRQRKVQSPPPAHRVLNGAGGKLPDLQPQDVTRAIADMMEVVRKQKNQKQQ